MKKSLARATGVVSSVISTLALSAQSVFAATNPPSSINIVGQDINQGKGYANDLGSILSFALRAVMVIAVLLVFGYLILGGMEWITSGGDKSKTESARNKITAAVVGLIILAASYAILTVILQILGLGGDLKTVINNVGTIN